MASSATQVTDSAMIPDAMITVPDSGDLHHGVPTAVFFDDVPSVLQNTDARALVDKLSALSQKYRYFEEKLLGSRQSLEEKIPEVQRALKAVRTLQERSLRDGENKKEIETQFELSDGIYVRAMIPPSNYVCLWLGANIMVEYSYEEAIALLTKNLASAQANLADTSKDIDYLRDQLNTTDVNLSRVYNHHVQSVRKAAAKGTASRGTAGVGITAK